MTDSKTFTIQVYSTTAIFSASGIEPLSGRGTFDIAFYGVLSDNGTNPSSTLVNGEIVYLQYLNAGVWTNLAQATTVATAEGNGWFRYTYTITPTKFPFGSYSFRIHYGGNPTKGLLDVNQNFQFNTASADSSIWETYKIPIVAVLGVGVIGAVALVATRKKKKKK